MINSVSPGYVLFDPRPIAAEAPYTFFLPSETEIVAIARGDMVKLTFEHVPAGQEWGVERMWVIVERRDESGMTGTLANDPSEPTAHIRIGDLIEFASYHVTGIIWSNPKTAPRPVEHREYWERCLVDDCVLDGTEPVAFIYREEPNMQRETDEYADSGWRIRGRVVAGGVAAPNDNKAQYVAIGAVLNKDDSWLHLIDAPTGAQFYRDFLSNVYMEQSN
jgi:hypothetical protein